jgi:pimeloyl-ACP methyl ester carboxylesterase
MAVETPPLDAFPVERAEVAPGLQLGYVRAGEGGFPLLLIHGYPETMRIWWRNIQPLADAGFDVIVPDLRGFGTSDLSVDGFYDPPAYAQDLHTLVHDVLGLERCVTAGGDLGGVVLLDLGLRFPGFVERQVFFNSIPPYLNEAYAAAGIPSDMERMLRATADYFVRQGTDADALCAELDTPERRRAYIADFYGHRLWGRADAFDRDDVAFMTEPFADGDHLRAAMSVYEVSFGNRELSDTPRLFEKCPIPTVVLWGPDDHVVPDTHNAKCEIAFEQIVGPFVVERAGHFLQWERADVFNATCRWFCADLLSPTPQIA